MKKKHLEDHFGPRISRLHVLLKRRIEHFASEYGITSMQSHIMVFLSHSCSEREVYQKDVEEEFKIRRSSVSSVLSTMEKNGLIERISSDKDARLKKLILTEKGEQIHKNISSRIERFDSSLASVLDDEEREQFIRSVAKLQAFLEQEDLSVKEDL